MNWQIDAEDVRARLATCLDLADAPAVKGTCRYGRVSPGPEAGCLLDLVEPGCPSAVAGARGAGFEVGGCSGIG